MCRYSVALAVAWAILFAFEAGFAEDKIEKAATTDAVGSDDPKLLTWNHELDSAIAEARRHGKPILVRAGAKWCLWCRKLQTEIDKPDVQQALAKWVLVEIDTDENPDDARRLNIGPIPAMRILAPDGRAAAGRDGFMTASKLLSWLESHGEIDARDAPIDVKEIAELSPEAVTRLVRQLDHRDASVREAVIRRLSQDKNLAAVDVVKAFANGHLAERLAALELLASWKAPIHSVDPWQPETVTDELLRELNIWASEQAAAAKPPVPEVEPLTPEQLLEARNEISKLVTADTVEAEAIGARLARIGPALLPEVREQRLLAESDKIRARLDWLRYRLLATDSLSLKWPGGLVRLASADSRTRHEAASELAELVGGGDESLLIELFSHPDPLMRELSLKALHGVEGVRAHAELSRLLVDPEPNVRAAVLKQLSENPSSKLVPQIASYITNESDPDLVVHAVRLLRAIKGKDAIECLIGQLAHSNWQVRAETVDALGEILTKDRNAFQGTNTSRAEVNADTYAAIIEVITDPDSFVVSRAVNALKGSDLTLAAIPLAKSAEMHPELAADVGQSMTAGANIRKKSLPLLRAWLTHADDKLRAAAITSLSLAGDLDGETELIPALRDSAERVRVAAATQLLRLCEVERPAARLSAEPVEVDEEVAAAVESSLFESVLSLFTQPKPKAGKMAAEAPKKADAAKPGNTTLEQQPYEAWLTDFRSGKKRPKWIGNATEPLQSMLDSASVREQVASGVVLVALGADALALSVLTKVATNEPRQTADVAKALCWLPWDQRLAFFEQLRKMTHEPDQLTALCNQFVVLRDLRASTALWDLLADEVITIELAHSIYNDLKQNHQLDDRYSHPPRSPAGIDKQELQRLAREGKGWQPRIALAILLLVDESRAADAAKGIFENPRAAAGLRKDAFRVLLIASDTKESQRIAAAELVNPESVAIESALAYLTVGEYAVQSLGDGGLHLEVGRNHTRSYSENDNHLPKDLSADQVRPLLASTNEDTAAQAAYVLAELGEPDGLERLIKRWRKAGKKNSQWQQLVYKAIAAGDDPRRVPILEEIYRSMAERPYEVRGLYWAIRSMHGPEVLRLRKRIREEVGMDQLR